MRKSTALPPAETTAATKVLDQGLKAAAKAVRKFNAGVVLPVKRQRKKKAK